MLGFVSEHLPKTGALGLSIMGGAGMLSVSLILPYMGAFYENSIQKHTIEGDLNARLSAGSETLIMVSILPAVLTIAFGILYFNRKNSKT